MISWAFLAVIKTRRFGHLWPFPCAHTVSFFGEDFVFIFVVNKTFDLVNLFVFIGRFLLSGDDFVGISGSNQNSLIWSI